MDILVIGGGGREHAICWSLAKSPKAGKLYCAPGNAGIGQVAELVPIQVHEFDRLAAFAEEKGVGLVVVGPDDPLADGIVDVFEAKNIPVFGPRKNAAHIEGSKTFMKDLLKNTAFRQRLMRSSTAMSRHWRICAAGRCRSSSRRTGWRRAKA